MHITTGISKELPNHLFIDMLRYRYQVFVGTLGWQLETNNEMDIDLYDRSDTIYLISQDDIGQINGCARLLPTWRPYLLGEVFPELLHGLPTPSSPEIWELSRFAAMDLQSKSTSPLGQYSSPAAVRLLQAALNAAARQGAKRIITVSPLGIERLLRKAGFTAYRAAPPVLINGHMLFACWIDVNSTCRQHFYTLTKPDLFTNYGHENFYN